MRNLIEQAIIHVINGEDAKADAIWHKYMVQRARQIHETFSQGEDVALREGWDDEIASESYFSESDLDDAEDGVEGAPPSGDSAAADAAADLDADLDAEGDDGMEDEDAEASTDNGVMGGEGDLEGKVEDLEGQIEKLTAEFEKMMAEMGEEVSAEDDDAEEDAEDVEMAPGDAEMAVDDDEDAEDAEMAADDDDEDADDTEMAADDDGEEDVPAVKEGKLPPALAAHMKKKKGEKKEPVEEDEEMEDITESVMAELEKVVADLTKDGMEIGDGKAITQNRTSPIPQKAPNARDGGGPVKIVSKNHQGFEREPSPAVKASEKRKNTKSGVMDGTSKVPAPSNKDGQEVGNGGTITQNRVSPLARNRNRTSI